MRVRHLVAEPKTINGDTLWRVEDLAPRYSGLYAKTKPIRAGWQWRSVIALSEHNEYIFLVQGHEDKDNWSAWLVLKTDGGYSLVTRFEYHGSHPGFHIHAHCERSGIEEGTGSINGLVRIPKATSGGSIVTLRRDKFWEQARTKFRISFPKGSLF